MNKLTRSNKFPDSDYSCVKFHIYLSKVYQFFFSIFFSKVLDLLLYPQWLYVSCL